MINLIKESMKLLMAKFTKNLAQFLKNGNRRRMKIMI